MIRARFYANNVDPRPMNWPAKHPYWVSGETGDGRHSIVISYADDLDYILDNWPEALEIESKDVADYQFTDRFPKPEWFEVPHDNT